MNFRTLFVIALGLFYDPSRSALKIAQKKTLKQAWRFLLVVLFIRDPNFRKFELFRKYEIGFGFNFWCKNKTQNYLD